MSSFRIPRLIDIGSNLSDPVFRGYYHSYDDKRKEERSHADDFLNILSRANKAGIKQQILTGSHVKGSREVLALSRQYPGLYCTVGCHPCSAYEFEEDPAAYLESLIEIISEDQALPIADRRVVAIGECGLDYDRLSLCSKEIQLRHFPTQLALATRFQLPLFLHCRHPEAHIDFVKIIKEYNRATELSGQAKLRGVVHSHSGSYEEALEMIELGFMIGINGCSLKTDANLECVRALPLSSLLVESDCPYCDIRPSHSSHTFLSSLPPHLSALYLPKSVKKERWRAGDFTVKGRNEPCHTGAIAWVVSRLKEVELQVVADQVWKNTTELFGLPDEVEEVVLPGSELSDKVNGEEELASIEG